MIRFIVGCVVGLFIGGMAWFPLGIMYAVQGATDSNLVRVIAVIKGLFM